MNTKYPHNMYNNNAYYDSTKPLDAYNMYKKNPQAMQEITSSYGYNNVQEVGAQLGQNLMPSQTKSSTLTHPSFLKGLAIGAGIAVVASNPTIQKALISGAMNAWTTLQASVEEMKEKIEDAKAEMSQED